MSILFYKKLFPLFFVYIIKGNPIIVPYPPASSHHAQKRSRLCPTSGTYGTGLAEEESTLVLPSSITDWSDSDLEEIRIILDSLEWVPAGV